MPAIGIIGGSGIYKMEGFEPKGEQIVDTPYGTAASDGLSATQVRVQLATFAGKDIAFIPRHGSDHSKSPTEVNYRGNIWALKSIGVKYIIAVNACGSLAMEYAPGDLAVPDDMIDFTRHRQTSFFSGGSQAPDVPNTGCVVHQGVAPPFCKAMSELIASAAEKAGFACKRTGTYVCVEGPRFSTRAESLMFQKFGGQIIGMTAAAEAFLCKEAQIAYASLCLITDYDVWHPEHDAVTVETVMATFAANIDKAHKTLKNAVEALDVEMKSSSITGANPFVMTKNLEKARVAHLYKANILLG